MAMLNNQMVVEFLGSKTNTHLPEMHRNATLLHIQVFNQRGRDSERKKEPSTAVAPFWVLEWAIEFISQRLGYRA